MKYVKIINNSNQQIVAQKAKIANNFCSRLIGLLGKSDFDFTQEDGLLIVPCKSVHSFGMKFTFDAVFLDKNNKVKYLIKNMKPWKISPIIISSCCVLELPLNTINQADIKIGDMFVFETN